MEVRFACPAGYGPSSDEIERISAAGAATVSLDLDPARQVAGAHVVVTDAWYSMGQEDEAALRKPIFEPYRVDRYLIDRAAPDGIFLHCLPAHRGEEVTDEVLDGARSRVWVEAANRLPAARGALEWLVIASEAGR
jgi:ornithine carbamoyltransferase